MNCLPDQNNYIINCILGLLLSLMMVCSVGAAAQTKTISYQLEPVSTEGGLRFRIDLNFNGHESGRTELILPSRSAGQTRLYEAIQQLEILTPSVKVNDSSEPWVKVLRHEPNEAIRVRYELVQDRADALQAMRGAGDRPILQTGYFHWLGNAWVRPGLEEAEAINFSLEWKNLPSEWVISNTFGSNERKQQFVATLRDFSSSVFVGGDFRLRTITIKEQPVRLALRGSWAFSDESFAALVEKIFLTQREFWNDFNYPDFFVSLLPLDPLPKDAYNAGTGLSHSFAMFATPNSSLNELKYLLAHEHFHTWNSRRLGRLKEPQELMYWFSEGFTEYYAFRLLWRSGLMTADEYLARFNETLRKYYTSTLRHETNERIARDFFKNTELSRLAYWRGHLLAANWNALIRRNSNGKHSLDDVMRTMFAASKPITLTAETISEAMQPLAKVDVRPDLKRFIDEGELIEPAPQMFGDCATLTTVELADFELGFDLEVMQTNREISNVIVNSAAYRAGLRDGQTVVKSMPFIIGDASQEVDITVKERGKEKTIRFFPASNNKTPVPQFKWQRRNASAKDNCEQSF